MELAKAIERARTHGPKEEMPPLEQVSRDGDLELSYAQQRLWIIDQLEPGSAAYNIPIAIRIRGRLDVDSLEKTLQELVRRHEVLRTRIEMRGGRCVQVIEPAKRELLEREVLGGLSSEKREEEVSRKVLEETGRTFDLEHGPLLRVRVLKLGEEEHVLLVTMHHIVSDGWSMGVLVREMGVLYKAYALGEESPLKEPTIQYADYAMWQRKWLQGTLVKRHLEYWRKQLAGAPPMELPTDRPRRDARYHRAEIEQFTLGSELTANLSRLSRERNATLFMTLLAAFNFVLHHMTKQTDILIGTDVASRNRVETESLLGFFVNQVVLRVDLSGNPSFLDVLARVRETCLSAYEHQDMPFDRLVEELNPSRQVLRSPFFQTKFVLQNTPETEAKVPGLELLPMETHPCVSKFDLMLTMRESRHAILGVLEYDADLFTRDSISDLKNAFTTVIAQAVRRPESALDQVLAAIHAQEDIKHLLKVEELQGIFQQRLEAIP